MGRRLHQRRWPPALGLVLMLLSLSCVALIPEWAESAPTSAYLDYTPGPTQSDAEFWVTMAPELIATTTPPLQSVPLLEDPCTMLPDESNRAITGSRTDRFCTADYYGQPGDAHSWLGGIRLEKTVDEATARDQLARVLEEEWAWKPIAEVGDAAFEYTTGKAIAYHVRFRRGSVLVQVQAAEGQIRLMTTFAVEVDERIQRWLGQ
jgi:hypothetical protein